MSTPYTYLIGWTAHNKFYYGARWSNDCDPSDLWQTYFTSSRHVKRFRDEHGEPDIVQVRHIFNDKEKCRHYEEKVLRKLNVLTEDKWLNKSVNGKFLPHGPQTQEHIEKRIAAFKKNMKGRGCRTGQKNSEEHKEKNRQAMLGKPKSKEHIENMKKRPQDTSTLTCPHCNKLGDYKNMKRWHMDRCKHNPQRKTDKDPQTVECYVCGYTARQSPNFYRNHNTYCKANPTKK